MRNFATSRTLAACGVAALAAIGSQAARAADITVSSAKIDAGRLKITGTTLTGGMDVRLDGQTAAAFNTTSTTTAAKSFAFNIVYHPGDYIVALQKVNPNNTLGAATNAVVADCGLPGVNPRGAWVPNVTIGTYVIDDVVIFQGSSWRAIRNNNNKQPASNPLDWEQFAAKGATGATGPGTARSRR